MGSRMGDGDSSVGATQKRCAAVLVGVYGESGQGQKKKKKWFYFFLLFIFLCVCLPEKWVQASKWRVVLCQQVGFLVGFAWTEAHSWSVGWSVG